MFAPVRRRTRASAVERDTVGRARERDVVGRALALAGAGKSQLVVIEGEPHVDATIRFGKPGEDVMTVLMDSTAVAAVNAIPFLCNAQPGVMTPTDLPVTGSPGALL